MERITISLALLGGLIAVSIFGFHFDSLFEWNVYNTEPHIYYNAPEEMSPATALGSSDEDGTVYRAPPKDQVESLNGISVLPREEYKAHPVAVVEGLNGLRIDD